MSRNFSSVAEAQPDLATPDAAQLLALARDRSIAGREALASSVAGMVTARASAFSSAEQDLADDILRTLIRDVERSVRAALAANLAATEAAPRDVILALANDEIEVAFPILAESPLLNDEELSDIVAARATGHRIAIAMRPDLGEKVSDSLIDSGDSEAIVCLLHNNDARISEATMGRVVDKAKTVAAYQKPLSSRSDLGPGLAMRLATFVADELQKTLIGSYGLDPIAVRNAAADAVVDAAEAIAGEGEPADSLGAKKREVRQMLDTLRRGEWPHFEAAMVRFSGLSTRLVHAILQERDGRRLTVLCRACGVAKSDFAPLFLLSRRATPDVEVVDAADVRDALALFDSIDRQAASRVVTRWRTESAEKSKKRLGSKI